MRNTWILWLLIFPAPAFCQESNENYPWLKDCQALESVAEKKTCLINQYRTADSMLQKHYTAFCNYFDSLYQDGVKTLSQSKDSSDIKQLAYLKKNRDAAIFSRNRFDQYRQSMMGLAAGQYEGGSLMPLVRYSYGLKITLQQLDLIRQMTEDFMNGPED